MNNNSKAWPYYFNNNNYTENNNFIKVSDDITWRPASPGLLKCCSKHAKEKEMEEKLELKDKELEEKLESREKEISELCPPKIHPQC